MTGGKNRTGAAFSEETVPGDSANATAKASRSIFTQSLASKLEGEGIKVPPQILDLLDRPFASFTEEDKRLYETHVKGKELLLQFSRLLLDIYRNQPEAARHSWRSMGFLLKDSPIKVCVAYVIKQDEKEQDEEIHMAAQEWSRPAARADVPYEAVGKSADASRKSYFTKKLERKLEERGIKVPAAIIALLDKPYDDFTPEDRRIYDQEFEERQLKILLSELMDDLFEETGRVTSGWTAMCRFLKDSPMKDIASFVIAEEERLQAVPQQAPPDESEPAISAREKLNVKPYRPAAADKAPHRRKKA